MLPVPLRPPILVARPLDWTRIVAWLAMVVVACMLVVVDLLVRLPQAWVEAAAGRPPLARLALVIVSLWIVAWLAELIYARLPRASYMIGRAVVFPEQGGRRRVDVAAIDEVVVEVRPPPVHEAFVLVMDDGTTHELCATHQVGAPALYSAIAKRVAARQRRAALRRARTHRTVARTQARK